ncbi:MAG: serine/threonine-protein kinase, partial [Solimonas sp.]
MTSTSVPLQSKSGTQIIGVLPAGARLLEYEIVRVLGRPGGFGVTYLAIDSNLQKEVAIKEYLPVDFAIRTSDDSISTRSEEDQPAFEWGLRCFLNEARVLAKFRHPNVVQVYRLFEAQKTAYIVLEHVQGQTLSEYLNARPGLDQRGIDAFLLPLLDGLAEVHAAGILHRDLKPENVLVRPDGSPVLIDFGAARNAIGGRSRSIMSVLTTGYAPIEQYSDNGLQGAWTDIYALGAVIYRAIIGRKPADAIDRLGRDPVEHLAESPRAGFDTSFLQAVDWALRVRADERPATVADWREALAGRRAPPAAPAHAQTPLLGTTTVDLDLDGRSTTRQAPSGEPPLLAAAPAEERTSPRPSISMAMPVPGIPTGEPLSQSDSRSTGVSRSSGSALPPDERTVIYRQPSPPAPSESSAVSASPPSAPSVSRARVTPVADRTTEPSSLLSGDGNAIAAPAAATPSAAAERLPPSKPPTPAAVATAAKPRWLKPAAVAAGIIVPLIGLVLFWPHGQPAPTDDASTVPAQEVAPARGSPLADAVQTPAETGANAAVSRSALPSGAAETPATGT